MAGPIGDRVSVVIPVRNGATTIAAQLHAVLPQLRASDDEIVVADNGSDDGTAAVVDHVAESAAVPVRRVDASAVPGVSHARNAGVEASRGDLILVCDADDVVGDSWVAHMVRYLAAADVVGGALETATLNPPDARTWREVHPPETLPTLLGFRPYAVGCNVGVRRHVVTAIGGWDESIRAGGDDIDFSWRAQLAGHTIVAGPAAVIAYRLRHTVGQAMRQAYAYGRAESVLYRRFVPRGLVVPSLRSRLRDVLAAAIRVPAAVAAGRAGRGRALFLLALRAGKLRATVEYRRAPGGRAGS